MNIPFPRKQWGRQAWLQIRKLTKIQLISLLDKDSRWEKWGAKGAKYIYHTSRYKPPYDCLTIHYHRGERFNNETQLRRLLDHWCCTEDDFIHWKIVK